MRPILLLPTLALLAAGCASSQKVGGQYLPVELRTDPPAEHAYLVPSTRWRSGLLSNTAELEKYAVDAQRTGSRRVVDMPYVFAARWADGRTNFVEFDPSPNSSNVVVLGPQ